MCDGGLDLKAGLWFKTGPSESKGLMMAGTEASVIEGKDEKYDCVLHPGFLSYT